MEKWKLYAFAAAAFAGITSVVAKAGLKNLSADLGLAVRSGFVLAFVLLNLFLWSTPSSSGTALRSAGWKAVGFLAFSALTTTLSWICYYRAMKDGTVSFVSLVDKGSIVVTIMLSVVILGEAVTWRMALGTLLIVGGLVTLVGGK